MYPCVCVCVLPARENLFFFLNNAASCSSVYSMEPRKWDHGVIGLWILNVGRVVDCLGCLIHSFIHSFIYGCTGSSLLCVGFL